MVTTSRPAAPPAADGVVAWVRAIAAQQDPRVGPTTPVVPLLSYGLPTRPYRPDHSDVFLCAGVAVKLHRDGTDAEELGRRLAVMAQPDVEPVWVQPLGYRVLAAPGGRVATLWPRVTVLSTLDKPPWEDAGRLLARLHRAPLSANPPAPGGRRSLAAAVTRLRQLDGTAGDRESVAAGFEQRHDLDRPLLGRLAELGGHLDEQLAGLATTAWVHGDFHLGHLAHTILRRSWKLVDVDHLGAGDPAWDLARPAAFYAAGLLDAASWGRFLDAYRAAGGPAAGASGDPWPRLELPARAAALVAAVPLLGRIHAEATADSLIAVAWGRAGA